MSGAIFQVALIDSFAIIGQPKAMHNHDCACSSISRCFVLFLLITIYLSNGNEFAIACNTNHR